MSETELNRWATGTVINAIAFVINVVAWLWLHSTINAVMGGIGFMVTLYCYGKYLDVLETRKEC